MQQYQYRKLPLAFLLVSLLTMLMAATGCGGGASASASQSQPSPSPTPSPTPTADTAHVATGPTPLDFGSIALGSKKTLNLTVTNSRGSSATVTQINITGAGYSFTSSSKVPFQLAAGQSATLAVTFAPTVAGSASGNIAVSIRGGVSPAPASLTGTGLASGQIGLTPANMNFGSLTVGTSAKQTGSLTASGTSITVSSASWNGAGYSVSGITFPATIAAGQSIPFTVTFAPQTAGTSNGTVSFVSNASNTPVTESMTGSGTAPQHSVALSWNASTSTVAGYRVYRSTQTGGPYALLNTSLQAGTTYSDTNVSAGTTYFYVVTAVDSSSQESSFSNESTAIIPTP